MARPRKVQAEQPARPNDVRRQDEVMRNPPDGGATEYAAQQSLQQQSVGETDPAARTTRNLNKSPALVAKPEKQGPVSITWLGEGPGGPETNEWNGITFKAGEPVKNITSPYMIAKARNNRFYSVAD